MTVAVYSAFVSRRIGTDVGGGPLVSTLPGPHAISVEAHSAAAPKPKDLVLLMPPWEV